VRAGDMVRAQRARGLGSRPPTFTVRRFGHVIPSLGVAIRVNWAWLLRVR